MIHIARPIGLPSQVVGAIFLAAILASATIRAATTNAPVVTTNAPSSSSSTYSKTIVISSPDDAVKEAKAALSAITNAPDESDADDKDTRDLKDKHHESQLTIKMDDGADRKGGHNAMASFIDSMIPVVGIVATFGMPVLIVFVVFYFRYRRRRDNLALAREFLAKGLPVPPELLEDKNSSYARPVGSLSRSRYDIRKGILWTFIGLGITVAMCVNNPTDMDWSWGLIPMIIGLGFLTAGWLDKQNGKDDTNRPASTPGASS